jgi:hypothetical protein
MVMYGTIFFFAVAGYAAGGRQSIPFFFAALNIAAYEYLAGLRNQGRKGRIVQTSRIGLGLLYWLILALILVPK